MFFCFHILEIGLLIQKLPWAFCVIRTVLSKLFVLHNLLTFHVSSQIFLNILEATFFQKGILTTFLPMYNNFFFVFSPILTRSLPKSTKDPFLKNTASSMYHICTASAIELLLGSPINTLRAKILANSLHQAFSYVCFRGGMNTEG